MEEKWKYPHGIICNYEFNEILTRDTFPEELRYLNLRHKFNQVIEPEVLPPNVQVELIESVVLLFILVHL